MRHKNDLYDTDIRLIKVLENTSLINLLNTALILEPCAGNGVLSTYLKQKFYNVYTNDIIYNPSFDFNEDATQKSSNFWTITDYDLIITNPPFNQAECILKNALSVTQKYVAFLLRLTFAEPTKKRAKLLQKYADNQIAFIPVNPRPRFKEGINPYTNKPYGTDSTTVAWFVWDVNFSWKNSKVQNPFIYITDWKE